MPEPAVTGPRGRDQRPRPLLRMMLGDVLRRILEQAAAGRPFRDMGVIVRTPDLYEPILRTTLDRFGIPARFYFDADLSQPR